ncbi:MAG: sialate O-acetylesterase [Pirellulales bacterium]
MSSDPVRAAPLQVFILAGQSNMEGHAKTETFDYIGDDPKTAWLLKKMKNPDGSPYVCKSVWISYLTGIGDNNGEGHGKLTTGYGSRRNPSEDGGKIGPEYMFGIAMEEALDAPILIIKTAWGGKSLFYDYRPPSAGIYPRTEQDIEKGRNTAEKSGHYYRLMIQHVKDILKNPKQACPSFSEQDGYEISGFVWFQGFNDLVNRNVYPVLPKDSSENRFQLYGELLSTFIQDVRNDLNAPKMPFVIGVLGVNGFDANPDNLQFRMAMAAPTAVPKFQGNVMAVETAPFWDVQLAAIQSKREKVKQMAYLLRTENPREANRDGTMTKEQQREYLEEYEEKLISPEERALLQRGASNAGYHYLGCAKTFALMGHAFADAMQIMIDQ